MHYRRDLCTGLWLALCAILALAVPSKSPAQFDRPWRVYLVPFSHTDIGYTAPVADVIQAHMRYLDTVVAYVGRTRSNDPGTRFRWTVEIPWVLDFYFAQRSQAKVDSFMACVRRNEIEVGAIHFGLQSDLCGTEELVRALYMAQELRAKYGIHVRTGMIDDTPGFTWSLAQLLAKGGIQYCAVAMNSFLDDFYTTTTLPGLFYWQGQDGTKTLVWHSLDPTWAYLEGSATCGIYSSPDVMQTKLTAYLQLQAQKGYPYDEILINCATGDNGPPNDAIVTNAKLWNDVHPDAKVIVSTISEFFDSVAVLHAGTIPTCSGDAPNWWTWLFAPSATGGYAQSRRAQVLLPAAETFATVASQLNPAFQFPANQLRDAYINNLYFEDHNLGAVDASGNAPFWSLKMGWVNAAGDTATSILGAAVDAIAGDIPTGSMPCVAVFNPLGWSRSVLTTLSLSVPLLASLGTFDVVDGETGLPLPVQRLQNAMLAFLAPDVPAVGYKVFRLVTHSGSFPPPGSLAGLQVQNESYTVHIDQATGSARSVIDRRSGRELVAADGAFNQYRFNNTFPPSGMSVVSSDSGRVLQSVTLRGNAQGSNSYQTTALLCAGLTRLEFYNTYDKLPPTATESVDFAFHFSLPSPAMHYEIPFGAVRLFDDELSGFRSNHYAVRHWLSVATGAGDYSATLAMDNATVTANPSGTFDGSVRMLISFTNSSGAYRAGIGPLSMNFSVSSNNGGFRPDSSMRAAYDFVTPAPVKILPAGQAGALDSVRLSFVSLDPSSILISTLKGAMDGNGIILRLYNPSTTALPVILHFAQAVQSAVETSLQEVDKFSLPFSGHAVSLSFDPFEVKTLRVRLTGPLAVPGQADVTQVFALAQNFPNPFNGATTIRYTIASPAAVTLTIFDLLGRAVKVLARSARTPGAYSEAWDGRSGDGRPVASGVYYYTLEARRTNGNTMRQTRAMVIIK